MQHKGTVTIETERLVLRQFTLNDAEAAFRNWESDEKVTKYLRWSALHNYADAEEVVNNWIKRYADDAFYQWAIVLKELGEPIGTISAAEINEQVGKVEIAYCIGSKWWGNGYASEGLQKVISFFFEEVKANRIEAKHDPKNPASGKVMKKCGLMYEGTLRKAWWNNKGIIDVCIYGLVAEDYFREITGAD